MKNRNLLSDTDIKLFSTKSQKIPLISPIKNENANGGAYALRIGSVHKPSPDEQPTIESGSKKSWTIKPGQMIVIVTLEKVSMPQNFIGTVFGANNIMMKGLLIVNPGIITSGHKREVTFYAINFSKINLLITEQDPIARIVFFCTNKNSVNPRNIYSDVRQDAAITARERFYPDFEGYFHSLVSPRISKYIREIVFGLLLGTVVFAALISTISTLSPIIAERLQDVPKLRKEIVELKKEIYDLKSKVLLKPEMKATQKNKNQKNKPK